MSYEKKIKGYIKDKIADIAVREHNIDIENQGRYQYIVLELYLENGKYYDEVLVNEGEIKDWKQFDWMN